MLDFDIDSLGSKSHFATKDMWLGKFLKCSEFHLPHLQNSMVVFTLEMTLSEMTHFNYDDIIMMTFYRK